MNVERTTLAVLCLTAAAAMAEGADSEKPAVAGLPNPAAVFCVENGGTYEIRRAADGSQTGVCILEDGTEVDAWDYFRKEAEPG